MTEEAELPQVEEPERIAPEEDRRPVAALPVPSTSQPNAPVTKMAISPNNPVLRIPPEPKTPGNYLCNACHPPVGPFESSRSLAKHEGRMHPANRREGRANEMQFEPHIRQGPEMSNDGDFYEPGFDDGNGQRQQVPENPIIMGQVTQFARTVDTKLTLLGYNSGNWPAKRAFLREVLSTVPGYDNPGTPWFLKGLLSQFGVSPQHLDLVAIAVFGLQGGNPGGMPPGNVGPPMGYPQQQNGYPPQYPPPMGYPQQQMPPPQQMQPQPGMVFVQGVGWQYPQNGFQQPKSEIDQLADMAGKLEKIGQAFGWQRPSQQMPQQPQMDPTVRTILDATVQKAINPPAPPQGMDPLLQKFVERAINGGGDKSEGELFEKLRKYGVIRPQETPEQILDRTKKYAEIQGIGATTDLNIIKANHDHELAKMKIDADKATATTAQAKIDADRAEAKDNAKMVTGVVKEAITGLAGPLMAGIGAGMKGQAINQAQTAPRAAAPSPLSNDPAIRLQQLRILKQKISEDEAKTASAAAAQAAANAVPAQATQQAV